MKEIMASCPRKAWNKHGDRKNTVIPWGKMGYMEEKDATILSPLCCWWLILPIQNDTKKLKMTETLAYGSSSESTH